MIKKPLFALSLLALVLAACAPATVPEITPTVEVVATRPAGQTASARMPGCTVVSRKPTPGSTEASLLPPPDEKDWIKGRSDAAVTIIEYSDFQ